MNKPFGIQTELTVVVCKDADDAIKQGYDYKTRSVTAIEIKQAIVVRNGTHRGNSTVDLLCHDAQGNEYVVMITGALLKTIPT